jgi:hypothetical protein
MNQKNLNPTPSLAYQMTALMQIEICNYPTIHQKSGDY